MPYRLFVGGLAFATSDDTLKAHFDQFGLVTDAIVMRDGVSRRSRGFGFVTYADLSCVEYALAQPEHIIDGRRVEAKRAVPRTDREGNHGPGNPHDSYRLHGLDAGQAAGMFPPEALLTTPSGSPGVAEFSPLAVNKLFVGGLHYETRDSTFRAYFEQFGPVLAADVMFNRETHKSRGFGFVTFEHPESVGHVLRVSHHTIGGKVVEVKRAVPRVVPLPVAAAQLAGAHAAATGGGPPVPHYLSAGPPGMQANGTLSEGFQTLISQQLHHQHHVHNVARFAAVAAAAAADSYAAAMRYGPRAGGAPQAIAQPPPLPQGVAAPPMPVHYAAGIGAPPLLHSPAPLYAHMPPPLPPQHAVSRRGTPTQQPAPHHQTPTHARSAERKLQLPLAQQQPAGWGSPLNDARQQRQFDGVRAEALRSVRHAFSQASPRYPRAARLSDDGASSTGSASGGSMLFSPFQLPLDRDSTQPLSKDGADLSPFFSGTMAPSLDCGASSSSGGGARSGADGGGGGSSLCANRMLEAAMADLALGATAASTPHDASAAFFASFTPATARSLSPDGSGGDTPPAVQAPWSSDFTSDLLRRGAATLACGGSSTGSSCCGGGGAGGSGSNGGAAADFGGGGGAAKATAVEQELAFSWPDACGGGGGGTEADVLGAACIEHLSSLLRISGECDGARPAGTSRLQALF